MSAGSERSPVVCERWPIVLWGRRAKQFDDAGTFDAIVVGSGIGGLGTAALLAKAAGRRVLVLEKHYTAGGFTHVFHRPGFEWDVGVHYVGQVHIHHSPAHAMFGSSLKAGWRGRPCPRCMTA